MRQHERRASASRRRTQVSYLAWLVVLVGGAVAAGVAVGASSDPRYSPPPAGVSPLDPGQPAAEQLAEAAREAGRRAERQREERQLPAAKAERETSRRQHHGLGRDRALALAAERFAGNATAPGLQPFAGTDDVDLLNRFTARVARDGRSSVIVSDGPLAGGEGGKLVPMDLRLDRRGENFVPFASPAPVALPGRLADGIRTLGGVTIEHEGTTDVAGEQVRGAVVYPSAKPDVDVVIRPTVEGAELYDVLRSEESAEKLSISVDAPGGASLRAADQRDDGFDVLADGRLAGRLGLPLAHDADGVPIDVETEADGSTLRMVVRHRGRDLRYPILVDPPYAVSESWNWGCPNSVCPPDSSWNGRAGWYFEANGPVGRFWSGIKPPNAWLGGGLGIEHSSNGTLFADGEYAYWRYRSVGTTRIVRASLTSSLAAATGSSLCLFRGVSGWSKEGNFVWERNDGPNTMCGDGHPDVCCGDEWLDKSVAWNDLKGRMWNSLLSGIYFRFGQNRSFFVHRTKQAFVELWDDEDPTITADVPSGWTKQTTFTATASDAGTGVREAQFNGGSYTNTCTGTRQALCPASVSVNTTLAEGAHDVSATTKDGAGRTARHGQGLRAQYWDEPSFNGYKVEKTESMIDFAWGERSPDPAMGDQYFSGRWEGRIRPPSSGSYSFYLQSDDNSEIWIDGKSLTTAKCCTESPAGTITLEAGRMHELRVEHHEQTGGAYARLYWSGPGVAKQLVPSSVLFPPASTPLPSFEVKVDTSSPAPRTPTGELWERRGEIIDNSASGSVAFDDGDPLGERNARRSGVQRVEAWLTYPGGLRVLESKVEQGASCTVQDAQSRDVQSADSCPLSHEYTFDGGNPVFPAGEYRIEFLAYDHAGNPAGEKSWTFTKGDLTDPLLLSLTHSPALPNGWVDNYNGRVTGSAADLGTGLHRLELTEPLTGGNQTRQTRYQSPGTETDCTGSLTLPCPATGDEHFDYNTGDYREGHASPSVVAVDASGRESSPLSYTLKVDHTPPQLGQPNGPLHDRRNRTDDDRREGLYDRFHSVTLAATDGSNDSNSTRRSGTKAINVKVRRPDGSVIIDSSDPEPQSCVADSCSKQREFTLDGDSLPDGEYTIEVVAVDQLDHTSPPLRWDVTVDRRGDIYEAREVTGDPATGAEVIATERHKLGTTLARREDEGRIMTRRLISCAANPQDFCGETRELSLEDDADTGRQDLLITRGTSQSDSRLDDVAAIRQLGSEQLGTPAAQGPIADALQMWQTAPPAHGANYQRHDRVEDVDVDGQQTTVTRQLYVDAGTRLPLRERVTVGGDVEQDFFYTYAKSRLTDTEVSANEFAVDRTAEGDTETEQLSTTDSEQSNTPETSVSSAAARGFREEMALSTDPTWIEQSLTDVTAQPAISSYGVPLFPAERLEIDERNLAADAIETHIAPYVATHAAGTYAGAWLDNGASGLIRVGFTSNAAAHLAPLRALFPYPDRLRVFTADATVEELDALVSEIDSDFAELDALGVHVSSVAPSIPDNAVRAGVDEPNLMVEQVLQARYGPNVVVAHDAGPSQYQSRRETLAIPPIYGGLKIFTTRDGPTRSRCTSGFSVRLGAKRRILTAAHCTKMHEEWRHTSGSRHKRIGRVTADVERFDDDVNRRGKGADIAQIRVRRADVTRRIFDHPRARDSFTIMRRQASENANPVNRTICVLGWVHTPPRCGAFMSQKATWRIGAGMVYRSIGQWRSYEGQKPGFGTSGGPTYRAPPGGGGIDNGGTAYGIHMGCECNFEAEGERGRGVAYFTPMSTVSEIFGTQLVGP
jgi:hypothetical protein